MPVRVGDSDAAAAVMPGDRTDRSLVVLRLPGHEVLRLQVESMIVCDREGYYHHYWNVYAVTHSTRKLAN
jgi:hypothetical protein